MDGFRYLVFLSHASSDKTAVEELALWLMRENLTPFLDKWDLVPGEDWTDALPAALAASKTCAVVIGPGDKGGWQTEEVKQSLLRRVRERNREDGSRFRIIPVLLPGASPPGAGEPSAFDFLAEYTWVKFDKNLDEEVPRHLLACGIRGIRPGSGPGVAVVEGDCPYRGLGVFDVAHANLFFGRKRITRELVEMLGSALRGPGPRLTAVVGPSGSGKSSLVRAGLVAELAEGALAGSETWRRVIFKPGPDPFESLKVELTKLPGGASLLDETRSLLEINRFGRDHHRSLHTAARLATRDDPPGTRLLVVADQFEEVFTQCAQEDDRRGLIANLVEVATVADGPVVVVLSIRADFLGKCAAYRALADALSGRQKLVGAMSEEELCSAIEEPALLAGGEFDPGLVDQLLRDVGKDPGMLPLLEFALDRLWRHKTGRRITAEDYRAIGKLRGALNQHADAILGDLRGRGLDDIARRIFLDLVEPGKGTKDTRRRVPKTQVAALAGWAETVEALICGRLVTTDRPDEARGETVEIVHESLIDDWTKIQTWLIEARKSIEARSEIQAAADRWVDQGRHPDYLLDKLPLANALEWSRTHAEDCARLARVREFLDESEATEQRHRDDDLEKARRQNRRVRRFAAVAVVLAVFAIGFGISAEMARRSAEREKDAKGRALIAKDKALTLADSLRLAALSESERDEHWNPALLLAVESLKLQPTLEGDQALRKSLNLLLRPIAQLDHEKEVKQIVFGGPDGKSLVVVANGHANVWNWGTGDIAKIPADDGVRLVALSRDGSSLATVGEKKLRVCEAWATRVPKEVWYLGQKQHESFASIESMAFSPDNKYLAIGDQSNWDPVRVFTLDTRQEISSVTHSEGARSTVVSMTFSPDPQYLVTGAGVRGRVLHSSAIVWDWRKREQITSFRIGEGYPTWGVCVALSPDGKLLAADGHGLGLTSGHILSLWEEWQTPKPVLVGIIGEVARGPSKFAFCRDDRLAVVGRDGVRIWELLRHIRPAGSPKKDRDEKDVPFLETREFARIEAARIVASSLDGRYLATAEGRVARVWKADGHRDIALLPREPTGLLEKIAFSPDGQYLATVNIYPTMARVWDLSGHQKFIREGVSDVAFSPDGEHLVAAAGDRTRVWKAWRTSTPEEVASMTGAERIIIGPDGRYIATRTSRSAIVWENWMTARPDVVDSFDTPTVALGPGGKLAWREGNIVHLSKLSDNKGASIDIECKGCFEMAFLRGGTHLATLSRDDAPGPNQPEVVMRIWGPASDRRPTIVYESRFIDPIPFSPDEAHFATLGLHNLDGEKEEVILQVRGPTGDQLWSFASGQRRRVRATALSPDGRHVALGLEDGTSEIWDLTTHQKAAVIAKQAAVIANSPGVSRVAFSPDGKYLATGNSFGVRVSLWRPEDLIREARTRLDRNLTRAEWRQYFPGSTYRRTFRDLPEPPLEGRTDVPKADPE
jgi:WD40 repeat protein